MFSSITRSFAFLARTPLVPPTPTGPAMVELTTITRAAPAAAGPSRPRAYSRTVSNMSVKSGYNAQDGAARPAMAKRPSASRMDSRMSGFGMSPIAESKRWASDKGKKELYSDESGAIGAGVSRPRAITNCTGLTGSRSTTWLTRMRRSTRTLTPSQQPSRSSRR